MYSLEFFVVCSINRRIIRMKKIGILTINDYTNYGNRLQNYATQEELKSLGLQVETIVNISKNKKIEKTSIKHKIKILQQMPIDKIYEKLSLKIWNYFHSKKI